MDQLLRNDTKCTHWVIVKILPKSEIMDCWVAARSVLWFSSAAFQYRNREGLVEVGGGERRERESPRVEDCPQNESGTRRSTTYTVPWSPGWVGSGLLSRALTPVVRKRHLSAL